MTIGKQIKTARINSGLTQTELAEKIGVFQQEIQRWENDKNVPIFCTISKIQKVLNIIIEIQ